MTRLINYKIMTPAEVKWYSDVSLKQCTVTFRNIADIEQFLINRCFGKDFYDFLISNLSDRRAEPPWFEANEVYGPGDYVRYDDGSGVKYYRFIGELQVVGEDSVNVTQVIGTEDCVFVFGDPSQLSDISDPLLWEETTYEDVPLSPITAWNRTQYYRTGERVLEGCFFYEAIQPSTGVFVNDTKYWKVIPRFSDPAIEEFYNEYLVHWLAYAIWFHKIPFIRGQDENATIQFRFVDYQIAEEALQSMRQEIQNHLYMIWENMKLSFPEYFPTRSDYPGCGCDDPTGVDCGTEALRKYAYRIA